jgi:hypothetical protein
MKKMIVDTSGGLCFNHVKKQVEALEHLLSKTSKMSQPKINETSGFPFSKMQSKANEFLESIS